MHKSPLIYPGIVLRAKMLQNQSVCVGPRTLNSARTEPVRLGRGVQTAGRPILLEGQESARYCRMLVASSNLEYRKNKETRTEIKIAQ
jgi:hypothetical protein